MQNEGENRFGPESGSSVEPGGAGMGGESMTEEARDAARETLREARRGDAGAAAETGRERADELAQRGRERAGGMVDRGRARAAEAVEAGKSRVADRVGRAGERFHERAHRMEQEGGIQARAAGAAHRAGDAVESGADYLRSHEVGEMRSDLERQIRANPLLSVGVALGAGVLLGRLLD